MTALRKVETRQCVCPLRLLPAPGKLRRQKEAEARAGWTAEASLLYNAKGSREDGEAGDVGPKTP